MDRGGKVGNHLQLLRNLPLRSVARTWPAPAPPKISGVSSGHGGVGLGLLFGAWGGSLPLFAKMLGLLVVHCLPGAHSWISGGARPSGAGTQLFPWCCWFYYGQFFPPWGRGLSSSAHGC